MSVQSYRDLDIWRRGMTVARLAYELTNGFPKQEMYGMIAQIRRAATSIPANIAEGWGRRYPTEFVQFLRTANGSRTELETHLLLSAEVGLCTQDQIRTLLHELEVLGKQIVTLERSLMQRKRSE